MQALLRTIIILLCIFLLAACALATPVDITSTSIPTLPFTPDVDPFFRGQGGGEPRTAGYWLLWNACAPDNKAEVAAANGGREAGWFILDDLLDDPGVLLGELTVESCPMGVNLLQEQNLSGEDKSGDPAYSLAGQLLAVQLNLAVGAEYCPAVDEAVRAGQLLLISQEFDGTGSYFSVVETSRERETADFLVEQLRDYNTGALCR
jgi:hypothetical protein